MMEEWRIIEGFDKYQVSNTGKIRSLNYNKTGEIKELKQAPLKNGYMHVILYDNNRKYHSLLVHRLVALAFLPNDNSLPMINHKDEDRQNNNINNLEWCDSKYNLNYKNRNDKLSRSLTNNPLISIPIIQLSKTREFINEFPSVSEAARSLNKTNTRAAVVNILKCCRGKAETQFGKVTRHTAYGYIWEFKHFENI